MSEPTKGAFHNSTGSLKSRMIAGLHLLKNGRRRCGIVGRSGRDDHRQEQAQRVDRNISLAPLDVLASVVIAPRQTFTGPYSWTVDRKSARSIPSLGESRCRIARATLRQPVDTRRCRAKWRSTRTPGLFLADHGKEYLTGNRSASNTQSHSHTHHIRFTRPPERAAGVSSPTNSH